MPPLLIAECCQNHNGSREILKRMIHAATEAGADYVKTQALHSRELTYRPRFEEGMIDGDGTVRAIKRPYRAEVERLSGLDLTPDDEAWFAEECLRAGVRSMITAFTRAAVERLGRMGYDAVKIASYDCRSYPLLRDVLHHWSTIVVSTGATYDHEVKSAAKELAGANFAFLHCVTLYPTPMNELHLRRMRWLRRFTPSVGYSDHTAPGTDGLWPAKVSLAMGADVVERHFTVLDPSETKDGPVSVSPAMLAQLRGFADRPRPERMEIVRRDCPGWEVTLGRAQRQLSHAELLNRDYYSGRVASKVDGREVFNWEKADLAGAGAKP